MPHLSIEYSANVDEWVDMSAFCECLRVAGIETGLFPTPGIRVRAMRCEHYAIADAHPENGFIAVLIKLREGRLQEKKEAAIEHLFKEAENFLTDVIKQRRIAVSMEMRDIDATLSPKLNTIRRFIDESK